MAAVKALVFYDDTKAWEELRNGDAIITRFAVYTTVVATNANLVALPGVSYSLPAATLTVNRTIDLAAINANGDYLEFDNQEAGFTWTFINGIVYDAYETPVTVLLANARYVLRRSNGKIKIFY